MRRFGFVFLVVLALVGTTRPATAATDPPVPVAYRPPVDAAPVVDPFRPPADDYGAGNRGVDYATTPAQPVRAAAGGEVTFAGPIGGEHHVVVLHADGLRTSYSFLGGIGVRRGQRVRLGDRIGTSDPSGRPLHFGVRAGEAYLDPLVLLGQRPPGAGRGHRPHLVPDPDDHRPLSEAVERRRLVETLRRAAGWLRERAVGAVARKVDLARLLLDTAVDLSVPIPAHLALAALRWQQVQATCSHPGTPPPPPHPPGTRRIAVLVGGLGSATAQSTVLTVDTAALGYDASDVHQFSYAGDGADPARPYGPADTLRDIGASGGRLAARLHELQARHPDAVVDVIAHSLGGLVARSAITTHGATPATVVTLGTPHQGTDLATAGAALGGSASGSLLVGAAAEATGHDAAATAIRQMSETSDFITELPEQGWPPQTTHVVSIAARGDPIVPSHQSRLDPTDAHNVVVSAHGGHRTDDHARLAGSSEALTEIRRALARQPPTCRSLPDALLDEALSRNQSHHQDLAGAALAAAGLYVDARTRAGAVQVLRR